MTLVETNSEPLNYALVNPGAVNLKTTPDLIELAQEIQKADDFVKSTTYSKLQMIAEQIRFLQEQAKQVMLEAQQNNRLHHVACNFKKIPGRMYYLYQKPSGQEYFSMLSPEEWGSSLPHKYIGSYRLEFNMSWTPTEELEQHKNDILCINDIMLASTAHRTANIKLEPLEKHQFVHSKAGPESSQLHVNVDSVPSHTPIEVELATPQKRVKIEPMDISSDVTNSNF